MGKVKQLMRSLRSKFTSSKSKSAHHTPHHNGTTSSTVSSVTEGSRSLISSVGSSVYASSDTQTPPTTPSKTPPPTAYKELGHHILKSSISTSEAEDLQAEKIELREPCLGPRATLEVNIAMLDFAKKLPLEELSLIGCSSPPSSLSGAEQDALSCGDNATASNPMTYDSRDSSRTLSLATISSGPSWSFACRSAHRIGRKPEEPDNYDDASSFGSLTDWGITSNGNAARGTPNDAGSDAVNGDDEDTMRPDSCVQTNHNAFYRLPPPSSNERDITNFQFPNPQKYDDRDTNSVYSMLSHPGELEHNTVIDVPSPGPFALHNGPLTAAPSLTEQSNDSHESFLRYIETPNAEIAIPFVSEEDFDALPDWSEVEDEAEYNTCFIKQPFLWSPTASSSSIHLLTMASPAVHIPSGYPRASLAPRADRQTPVKERGEKRKQSEPHDLGSA
ncbi:uncharacterized protein K460DRAFT_365426 [Cucurbitaria berberidis CBS 394.84]|uniref:Uncharacterized protein n=1 Tax=Cucurbitaria berberidis CBS 394.84 TaxID=1168544 RepID=A0A9P4GQ75_9PLEO|nr:uncharacterized protein K460DRAFT_365426 [Cucurbitaria berberidis CBS 394.84]KAF1849539.1 hypothetical protein K460DRAFT_365426 [Cucurbitaria berberidis CBS 394.84]